MERTVQTRGGLVTFNDQNLDLKDVVNGIRSNPSRFVQSLVEQYDNRGLSSKQETWARYLHWTTASRSTAFDGSIPKTYDRVKNHPNKKAILRLKVTDYQISIKRTRAGRVIICRDRAEGADQDWVATIEEDGRVFACEGHELTNDEIAILLMFEHEPLVVAANYGRETGCCCFCARQLTDKRSVTAGYGPICAEKFGLAWG